MDRRLPILLVLAACEPDGPTTTETGDTATSTPGCGSTAIPVTVDRAAAICDEHNQAHKVAEYWAETSGVPAGDAMVFVQVTGDDPAAQWSENQVLTLTESDACGTFAHLESGALVIGGDPGTGTTAVPVSGVSCNQLDPANQLTSFAIAALDESGAVADCLAWGADPAGMIANTAGTRVEEPAFDLSGCEIVATP